MSAWDESRYGLGVAEMDATHREFLDLVAAAMMGDGVTLRRVCEEHMSVITDLLRRCGHHVEFNERGDTVTIIAGKMPKSGEIKTAPYPGYPTDMQAQTASGKKVLVAYFSHSGNTREMARQIAEATNGDLFEIVPQSAYPAQYDAVMAQAKREIGRGYRPALKGRLPDIGAYDVVFVG